MMRDLDAIRKGFRVPDDADALIGEVERLRAALEIARHNLVTLNGLEIVDMAAYGRAREMGADANGAWDVLCDSGWTIDESETIAAIDVVLPAAREKALGGDNG
jgi:hypothetical protein